MLLQGDDKEDRKATKNLCDAHDNLRHDYFRGILFRILSAAVIIVSVCDGCGLCFRLLLLALSHLHARAAPVHCEFFEYVFKNGVTDSNTPCPCTSSAQEHGEQVK